MRLVSLAVRHWRGLAEVTLDGLSPRLNLVVGPNEAGKSRLFQALQYALWESPKGKAQHKLELKGWGSKEAPWVRLEFEHGGTSWVVEKGFLVQPFARLEGVGRTFADDAAEDHLRELLGAGGSGSREVKPDEQGLWRLLWLPQGHSRKAPHEDLNPDAQARLEDQVALEVGEIAAGPEGERLLERARQEAARFWTTGKGQPTGELGQALAAAAKAKQALETANQAREAARADATALAELVARRQALGQRRDEQAEKTADARTRHAAAQDLERQLAAATTELERRQREVAAVAEKLAERERVEAEHAEVGERLATLDQARSAERARLDPLEAALREARDQADAAAGAADEARAAMQAARRAAQAKQLAEEVAELGKRWREAETLESRRRELESERSRRSLNRATLERLERLAEAARTAKLLLDAAAAQVELTPLRDLELEVDKAGPRALVAGKSLSLPVTAPLELEILGVAKLTIRPGGSDAATLGDRERDTRASLAQALAEAGVETVEAAQRLREATQSAENELARLAAQLQLLAPEGLAALAERRAAAEAKLAGLPPAAAPAAGLSVAAAEAAEQQAAAHLRERRNHRDELAAELEAARSESARGAAQAAGLEGQRESANRRLAGLAPAQELQAALDQSRREAGEALLKRDTLRERFAGLGGERAAAELEQAERALASLDEEQRTAEIEVHRLEAGLAKVAGQGLHEQAQQAEEELEHADLRLRAVDRRARAARKLVAALEAARQETQQRFTEPVRRRIEPYLVALFHGSSLALDDRWTVKGLQTANQEEPFSALSGGAQEQLGILVRIGLAEILAGNDRLPLVLDDALVNTDDNRRQTLLRLLDRASDHLQIVLFTCHEDAYDSLGAQRVYHLDPRRARAG